MFRTRLIRSLIVPLAALLAASAVTAAHASTPMPASGTLTYTSSTFNNVRSAGGNVIIGDLTATVSYTGTFSGTSSLHGILILHANGTANFHDVEVFTGTVDGVPGTVTLNLNGNTDRAGVIRATDVVLSASGALAGLHGVLDEIATLGPNGPAGTYSGSIQFGAD